ncbi:hypothetical protein SSX86_000687 [Deinandra increscens subsp. villosa]|uniref:Agglutinin domain-containing protein n=1 Tax=Deinandra increscens subsp. villosa TaxID=3103831 RepID=A0AAP0H8K0_9ASTR
MPMTNLPDFFVLQAEGGGPFLRVVDQASGLMKFDETDVWSPRAKFAIERSKTQDLLHMNYVHIRSCFNNKYWKVKWVAARGQPDMIYASADEPNEEEKSKECTGFRPLSSDIPVRLPGFRLCWISQYFYLEKNADNGNLCLSQSAGHTFPTIDWRTLLVLPSQVSFRLQVVGPDAKDYGNGGKYLCSSRVDGEPCLRFEPGVDPADTMAAYELIPTADGNYSIKDLTFGKFWRVTNFNIVADAEERDLVHDNNTKFSPVKVSENAIALRSVGGNSFVGPAYPSPAERLCVGYPTVTTKTRLIVEERVLKKEIANVTYRLSESKIYNEEVQEASHSFATNNSPDKETTVTLTYSLTDSKSNNWSNSESLTLGTKVEFKTAAIPIIAKNKVELSADFTYTHDFGSTETVETKREGSYTVVVPPLTTMKLSLMFTKALCDVPYSYTQSDSLYDGTLVSVEKDDGIYNGIMSFDFYFESIRTNLKEDGTAVEPAERSITRTYLV